MAIVRRYQTPHGVIADYHRLTRMDLDPESRVITMVFSIYLSEEAYKAGSQSIWQELVRVPLDNFITDPRQLFYTWAIQHVNSYLNGGTVATDQPIDLDTAGKLKPEFIK